MASRPTIGPADFKKPFNERILQKRERDRLERYFADARNAGADEGDLLRRLKRQLGANFAKKFATGTVTYRNGAVVSITDWAEMYSQTSTMDAMRQAQVDFSLANGMRVAKVKLSPAPCPLCVPWGGRLVLMGGPVRAQGKKISLPTMNDMRAAGWGHPNCECIIIGVPPTSLPAALAADAKKGKVRSVKI